ncbi:uncharacterized protein LOC135385539 [Ornithodoros turicata]|uniref:uncharacterized protein LOC135385539 n=1 Tax=Ornithodoros turicata TaxID=34597 RepID=UPI003139A302
MESVKLKTPHDGKAQTDADAVVNVKSDRCKVEADSVIDISQLSNSGDLHGDASGSKSMGLLSGSPEEQTSTRAHWMKSHMQQTISDDVKKKITTLLDDISQLSDVEKLYLYLQLPTGTPVEAETGKQRCSGNPLGKKADAEVAQTYTWIQSHLEEDSDVSLPKQEVYEEYRNFFAKNKIEPLCAADFGKVMKHVFPTVRPRRLGTRGNSRYCYSGLRKKCDMKVPQLPDLSKEKGDALAKEKSKDSDDNEDRDLNSPAWHLVLEWAEKLLSKKFSSVKDLAQHLVDSMFVDSRSLTPSAMLTSRSNNKVTQTTCNTKAAGKQRTAQQQLQRKLQEKKRLSEQKKKISERGIPDIDGSRSGRNSSGACQQKGEIFSPTSDCLPDQSPIKADPDIPSEAKLQASATGNNIIFVPTVQGLQLGCQHTADNQSCSLTTTCKYKKIQPKPTSRNATAVFLQFSGERDVISSMQSKRVVRSDGESASPPSSSISVLTPACNVSTGIERKIAEGASKRQSDDTECQSHVRKRRHTGEGSVGVKANGDEPLLANKEEMSVVHLEKEAFNEYFGDGTYDTALVEQFCKDELVSNGKTSNDTGAVLPVGIVNNLGVPNNSGDNKKAKLSQLRMLLEKNLPGSYQRTEAKAVKVVKQEGNVTDASSFLGDDADAAVTSGSPVHKNASNSHWKTSALSPGTKKATIIGKDDGLGVAYVSGFEKFSNSQNGIPAIQCNSSQPLLSESTRHQYHTSAVPRSPSTRGRFFTPISPQMTPLPDGVPSNVSTSPPVLQTSDIHTCTDMISVAVGTSSQPPSATSSPFVSPRGTPVPWTRSRHNSGQSGYSGTPRQTPFQALDSGVSSISGSPFVSPQATPVTSARARHCLNYNCPKTVSFGCNYAHNRARHGSGPGNNLISPRSAPLSPMVGDCSTQTTGFTFPAVGETPPQLRSRHSSASSIAPPSPQSAPLSPIIACGHPSVYQAPSAGDEPASIGIAECSMTAAVGSDTDSGIGQQPVSPGWLPVSTSKVDSYNYGPQSSSLWLQTRQRHASGPSQKMPSSFSSVDPFTHEIQEYLKNAPLAGNANMTANRSRSVPVHQMFMLHDVPAEPFVNLEDAVEDTFSKSYPATPVLQSQCFNFPTTSQPQASSSLAFTDQGVDTLAPQDDMFLTVAQEWNNNLERESSMKFGEDDDFDADLQSTLEDLKDCDEFSKFAKELDFTPENEDDMN